MKNSLIKTVLVLFLIIFCSLDGTAQKRLKKGTLRHATDQTKTNTREGLSFFEPDLFVANRLDISLGYLLNPNGGTIAINGDYFFTGEIAGELLILNRKESMNGVSFNRTGVLAGVKYLGIKKGPLAVSGGGGFSFLSQKVSGIETQTDIAKTVIGPYLSLESWISVAKGFSLVVRADQMFFFNQAVESTGKKLSLSHYGILIRKRL